MWLRLGPAGFELAADLELFAMFGLLCLTLIGLGWTVLFLSQKERLLALFAVVLAINSGIGLVIGHQWAKAVRHHFFLTLGEHAEPLVDAIERYDRDHGKPPPTLEALVPAYLSRVPETSMRAYPRFWLVSEPNGIHKDRWALLVSTPSAVMNFDEFVYYPSGAYPEHFERIGRWAYIHE